MPDLVPWLIGLALALLVTFLYWADRRYPAPTKPRESVALGLPNCSTTLITKQAQNPEKGDSHGAL
jgi:hypothetical protein